MGCKTKLKINDNIKSREAWSDLAVVAGYYLERGERSFSALHEKVKQHFPDVGEADVAIAAREVMDEIFIKVPSVSNKKATIATLNAEIKRLTDPTAIDAAKAAIAKLNAEDTSKFTPDQWRARYAEIIREAKSINRGARIDEAFFVEREAAFADPEVRKVRQQLNVIKKEADAFITAAERANKPIGKRFWFAVADSIGSGKSLQASLDISAPGRQGILLIMANPLRAKNAFRDQFRAISNAGAEQVLLDMQEHPRYTEAVSDGVLSVGGPEEAFPSDLVSQIPGIKQSSAAYSAFIHRLRIDWYDHLATTVEKGTGKALTQKERKAIANFVNIASGRGNVRGLTPDTMDMANKLMFSARLALSRIQYLLGTSALNPDASPAVKKAIVKTYGQTALGLSTTMFVLSQLGADTNTDNPTEHNFLKATFGNTDYDLTGGLSRYIVLGARMADNNSNSFKKVDQVTRFLRGLASPSAGLASDAIINNGKFYFRRDSEGKQELIWDNTNDSTRLKSAERLAIEMLTPIGVGNIIEQNKKGRPVEETTRNALIEAIGIGVTNREDRPKSPKN